MGRGYAWGGAGGFSMGGFGGCESWARVAESERVKAEERGSRGGGC